MITTAGGLQTLNDSPRIQILASFVAAIWEASYLPRAEPQRFGALKEIREHLVLFQGFFLKLRLIHLQPSNSSDEFEGLADRPLQAFLIGPGGPWRTLLSPSAHDPSCTETGVSVHDLHRSACLLYLCAALVDYQDDDVASEEYLDRLLSSFQAHGLHVRPKLRLFVFVLIKAHGDGSNIRMEDSKRSWLVVRLMQVIKLLSWETRAAVNKALLNFLLSDVPYAFSEDSVIADVYAHPSITATSTSHTRAYSLRGDSDLDRARDARG